MKNFGVQELFKDNSKISEKLDKIKYKINKSFERKSWENADLIYQDSLRVGFGEHGEPGVLTDPEEIKKNEELRREFGTSVLISDKISVNRSIPDRRVKGLVNFEILSFFTDQQFF